MKLKALIAHLRELEKARGDIPVWVWKKTKPHRIVSLNATAGVSTKRWPNHGSVHIILAEERD